MTPHTILVVEDNPATRRMVTYALTRRGHRVIEAADGANAVVLMEREQPNLILQDVILPDIDGFALVAELRKRARGQVTILAFSGFTSRNDEARISAVGFDDVIIKPVEPSHLVQLVEAHLPIAEQPGDRFGAGRRVVVADDDPVQLKLTRFRLEKAGFHVETAKDGREALQVLSRNRPDIIISDILMPNLDGFGLALAVRQDPMLAKLPLLLMTSSYIEEADRELARRAGASEVVPRTPEQREMLSALRILLDGPPPLRPVVADSIPEIENERTRRVVRQLERHVLMNAGLAQRCSALSAELAVLAGISEAVLKQENLEEALDQALAACFDAGGISAGALYRLLPDGKLTVRPLGTKASWQLGDLDSFFGNASLLHQIIAAGQMAKLPSPALPVDAVRDTLTRSGSSAVLVVPLIYLDIRMGALVMMAHGQELEQQDWPVFAQGVANQIAQSLALASAFEQRKAAERAADESRADWQALVENAPDTIMRIDRDGIVRFVNHLPPPLMRDEVVGRPWLQTIPSEYRDVSQRAMEQVLASGESSSHEIVLPAAEGANDWYSSRLAPIVTGGQITGAIVISQRITQRKQQEMQLIVSDRMASVGTLAAGVAHEINNPLAAVMANLDLAHREASELERGGNRNFLDYLQDAQEAAERVRLIVRDLKVFSRAEEERMGPTDVRAVLESTLRMAWNEIRHRARLVKDFAALPPVEANESRLGQVFLNLIINATQAIGEGHTNKNEIRLSTRMDVGTGLVAIDVTDTGSGMPIEVQRRLFTPFFTTKPVGVGTGLGLSICQRIITSMGGEIRVQSKVGQGSTFTVLLPPAKSAAAQPVRKKAPLPLGVGRRGNVLVIDDERIIAVAVQRSLSKEHDVAYASSAGEALTRLRGGEEFDVILCDLMMPEMTGMDLYAELEQTLPEQARRMVFVTGGAFTQRAREFLETVPNTRVEKPFNVQQLRALVNDRVR